MSSWEGYSISDFPEIKKQFSALEAELADLQRSFDLRWNADMRAIKRWQAAGPNRELTWPDHADLVVWLLERLEAAQRVLQCWQCYGCPDCGGDCASANPPVAHCIMQETRAALAALPQEPGSLGSED